MWLLQTLKNKYNEFISSHDVKAEEAIHKEYSYLLALSLTYSTRKPKYLPWIFLQMGIYVALIISHSYVLALTLMKVRNNMFIFTNSLNLLLIFIMSFIFGIAFNLFRSQLSEFHRIAAYEMFSYGNGENHEVARIKSKYYRMKMLLIVVVPTSALISVIVLMFIGPWIDNILYEDRNTGTVEGIVFDLPVVAYYPLDVDTVWKYYILLLMQYMCAVIIGSTICSALAIYINGTTVIMCQLEILKHSINQIEERSLALFKSKFSGCLVNDKVDKLYDDQNYLNCIEFCLIQNIQHHQHILKLFRLLAVAVEIPGMGALFTLGIIMGISAFTIIYSDKIGGTIGTLAMCAAEALSATVVCAHGQLICDLGNEVREALYNVKWFNYSKRISTLVLMFMTKSTEDMMFIALFGSKFNLETYLAIWNATFSYFNLLLAAKK